MDKLDVVAWRWRVRPDGVWNYQEDEQRIPNAEQQPLTPHAPAQAEIDRLRESEDALQWAVRSAEARAIAAEAEVAAVLAAIPGVRFMDPPDGGDPKPHEQVQRMADALKAAEAEVSRLQRLLDDTTGQLNTAEAQVFTLRGEVDKAIRILSDRKEHQLTRILDARDVLILSKPATLKDTPHD